MRLSREPLHSMPFRHFSGSVASLTTRLPPVDQDRYPTHTNMDVRSSRLRQSNTGPTQRTPATQLPPYEAPSFSLNPAAQRALANLTTTHSLRKLNERLEKAQGAISLSVSEINDRLTEQEAAFKRRKERSTESNEQDAALEQSLEELRAKTEKMTSRMEERMRKLIDGRHGVQQTEEAIGEVADDTRANASTQASTQHRSQRRRRDIRNNANSDDDTDEDEYQEPPTPTDPEGRTQTQNRTAPIDAFRQKLSKKRTRYQSASLYERYAESGEYRQFRKLVHDAQHPDDDVPLQHHSEWFSDGAAPAPGVTTRSAGNVNAEDDDDHDDDDIAVSRATISTKCPLTLQEFRAPLTSKKCPHSFESEAILDMINRSAVRVDGTRGRTGQQAVQCPVGGCQEMLSKLDLHTDAVLARKIKRIQKARELEAEEGSDGEAGGRGTQRAQRIDSSDGEEERGDGAATIDDILGPRGRTPRPKVEPRSTAADNARARSPRTTQVVDLGDDEDESEEERVYPEEV